MTAQWEAWAKRSGAIPWIWQPAYGEPPGSDPPPAKGAKKGKGKKKKGEAE